MLGQSHSRSCAAAKAAARALIRCGACGRARCGTPPRLSSRPMLPPGLHVLGCMNHQMVFFIAGTRLIRDRAPGACAKCVCKVVHDVRCLCERCAHHAVCTLNADTKYEASHLRAASMAEKTATAARCKGVRGTWLWLHRRWHCLRSKKYNSGFSRGHLSRIASASGTMHRQSATSECHILTRLTGQSCPATVCLLPVSAASCILQDM